MVSAVEGLSRSSVEPGVDGVEVILGEGGEAGALGDVLAQQPVRVLVGAPLPGLRESQKLTGSPVSMLNLAWGAISLPWSQAGTGADGRAGA